MTVWCPRTSSEYNDCAEWLLERGIRIHPARDVRFLARLSGKSNGVWRPLVVVAYNTFSGRVCQGHIAGEGNWLSREFLWAMFDYPFNQCNVVELFTTVNTENPRAMRLNTRLGFVPRYLIHGGWDDDTDMLMTSMRKEHCQWLRPMILKEKSDGKKFQPSAT